MNRPRALALGFILVFGLFLGGCASPEDTIDWQFGDFRAVYDSPGRTYTISASGGHSAVAPNGTVVPATLIQYEKAGGTTVNFLATPGGRPLQRFVDCLPATDTGCKYRVIDWVPFSARLPLGVAWAGELDDAESSPILDPFNLEIDTISSERRGPVPTFFTTTDDAAWHLRSFNEEPRLPRPPILGDLISVDLPKPTTPFVDPFPGADVPLWDAPVTATDAWGIIQERAQAESVNDLGACVRSWDLGPPTEHTTSFSMEIEGRWEATQIRATYDSSAIEPIQEPWTVAESSGRDRTDPCVSRRALQSTGENWVSLADLPETIWQLQDSLGPALRSGFSQRGNPEVHLDEVPRFSVRFDPSWVEPNVPQTVATYGVALDARTGHLFRTTTNPETLPFSTVPPIVD